MKPLRCAEKIGDRWPLNDFLLSWDIRAYRTRNVVRYSWAAVWKQVLMWLLCLGGSKVGRAEVVSSFTRRVTEHHQWFFFFFSPSRLRRYPETSIAKLEFGLSSSGDSAKQWAGREYESGGGWGNLEKWSLATQRRFWSKPLSTV